VLSVPSEGGGIYGLVNEGTEIHARRVDPGRPFPRVPGRRCPTCAASEGAATADHAGIVFKARSG